RLDRVAGILPDHDSNRNQAHGAPPFNEKSYSCPSSATTCVTELITAMSQIAHDLRIRNHPNQYFKETDQRCEIEISSGNEGNSQRTQADVGHSTQKDQKRDDT